MKSLTHNNSKLLIYQYCDMNDEVIKAGLDVMISLGGLAKAVKYYIYGPDESKSKPKQLRPDKDTVLVDRRRKGKRRR